MKIDKPVLAWAIDDLEILRDDPYNLEDMNIEYKEQYNGDPDELRKDIISFANSEVGGYILYGIKDDPFDLIGISRSQADNLKNAIDSIINTRIDPHLDPLPIMNTIYLSERLFVLGVQIFPKRRGVYAIRKSNNPNDSNFRNYSFWIRSDGRKRQLSMEEVNSYIIKTDPYKKNIEVRVEFGLVGLTSKFKEYISVHGVNKSVRPITVSSYGFQIFDNKEKNWLGLWLRAPNGRFPTTTLNTPPGTKLQDGDKCQGYYPISLVRDDISKYNITLPTSIKGVVYTHDGPFFSKEKDLKEEMITRNLDDL